MYDKFSPFKRIEKQNLTFEPTTYVVWGNGKVKRKGETTIKLLFNVINLNGFEQVKTHVIEPNLKTEIQPIIFFDDFITATDRLQLITIPESSNNTENTAILMFRTLLGATR